MDRGEPAAGAEIPPQWARKPPTLVVMVGPPGTGKSHLVRELAARVSVHVLETDEIRRRIATPPTHSPRENARVFIIAHRELDRYLRSGENVVFDATNVHRRDRRKLYRIAEKNGARVLVVRAVAPDEVVAGRLKKRAAGLAPRDRSEAGWEVYARMKAEYEEINRPHLVVDTSRDLRPAIDEIVRLLQGD